MIPSPKNISKRWVSFVTYKKKSLLVIVQGCTKYVCKYIFVWETFDSKLIFSKNWA